MNYLQSFHKDEHEDVLKVNNIETNIKRESKRPATAALCRRFAHDKKNVGIINKDIRNFAEVTNEQSMRIMMKQKLSRSVLMILLVKPERIHSQPIYRI